jgi:hypothetical protein
MSIDTISPLRQRMIEDMNARKLCAGTQKGHIRSCRRFAAFLKRSPDTATASTFEEAFGTYENTRKERANGVQLASREQANEIQGVTNRGPNLGATADDRGLYLYNPVTVPLAPAGEISSNN